MANLINIGGGADGGSSVEPNPQGTATDTLVKLGIEGTIYDFAGGGSGSSYTETTLWSGSETPSTSGTQITLSDNISNYDEIVFVMNTDYVGANSFLISQLTIGETYIATIYAPSNYGAYWSYDSDTQITIKSQASASLKTYVKVIGIKYGGGAGHTYSTAEQVVGTWVDGKTLYEKTVSFTTASTSSYTQQSLDLLTSEIDTIFVQSGYVSKGENVASWGAYASSVAAEQCVGFIYKGSTNITFDYRVGSSYFAGSSNLTIRYTKT